MGSIALIAPKGGGRVAYAVERLWEGLRRETTCEQDLEQLGILLLCCLRRGLTEMCRSVWLRACWKMEAHE
jgi:hypothetical protein